jgi:hypothetical protein
MHNSRMLFALIVVGFLLVAPLGWYLGSDRVRLIDANVAIGNLAELPALQLRERREVNLTVKITNDPAWKRIRRGWGEPAFEVALVSSQGEYQYCLDGINVSAQQNGESLNLEKAGWIYGYSYGDSFAGQCTTVGRSFRASPGSTIEISLKTSGEFGGGTILIVRPTWPYTKDKLVGVDLDKDARPIVIGMAVFGLLLVIGASLVLRANGPASAPVPYHRNAQS